LDLVLRFGILSYLCLDPQSQQNLVLEQLYLLQNAKRDNIKPPLCTSMQAGERYSWLLPIMPCMAACCLLNPLMQQIWLVALSPSSRSSQYHTRLLSKLCGSM
jgi:hypothetical protein